MTQTSFLTLNDLIQIGFTKAQQQSNNVRHMLSFPSRLDLEIASVRFFSLYLSPMSLLTSKLYLFLGQRFALLEEKVVLSTLFRRYSLRATQSIEELQLSFEAIMRPVVPIKIIVEHRQFQ